MGYAPPPINDSPPPSYRNEGWRLLKAMRRFDLESRYADALATNDIPAILTYGGELDARGKWMHDLTFGGEGEDK